MIRSDDASEWHWTYRHSSTQLVFCSSQRDWRRVGGGLVAEGPIARFSPPIIGLLPKSRVPICTSPIVNPQTMKVFKRPTCNSLGGLSQQTDLTRGASHHELKEKSIERELTNIKYPALSKSICTRLVKGPWLCAKGSNFKHPLFISPCTF